MNANTFQRITTRNDIARDIVAGFASVDADTDGRLAARGSRARRRARRARRPRTGTGGTRGGAAGPGEPARRDPRLPSRRDADAEDDPLGYLRAELGATRYPGDGHQAAAMTSYRQMRRNGRRARRVGLQPIMVINTDGQFPTPVGRDPRPRRVAVPFRTRARLHRVRDARGGLVGCISRTRTGGRTCSASPLYPRGCSCRSARGSACPGSPSGSMRAW